VHERADRASVDRFSAGSGEDQAAFGGRPPPGRSCAPRASSSRPPAAAKTACRLI